MVIILHGGGITCDGRDCECTAETFFFNEKPVTALLVYQLKGINGQELELLGRAQCTDDRECAAPGGWSSEFTDSVDEVYTMENGYKGRTHEKWLCSQCVEDIEYHCSEGWYGTATSENTGCTRCPPYKSEGDTLSDFNNNKDITGCYVPANISFYDGSTGHYVFIEDCHHK